jgi:hypothetical protein
LLHLTLVDQLWLRSTKKKKKRKKKKKKKKKRKGKENNVTLKQWRYALTKEDLNYLRGNTEKKPKHPFRNVPFIVATTRGQLLAKEHTDGSTGYLTSLTLFIVLLFSTGVCLCIFLFHSLFFWLYLLPWETTHPRKMTPCISAQPSSSLNNHRSFAERMDTPEYGSNFHFSFSFVIRSCFRYI